MKIRSWIFGSVLGLLTATQIQALEIPLSGGKGADAGASRIGYVDMERVFQVFPQTKDAKEDYFKRREKMREDLTLKERKVEDGKQKLAILEATLLGLRKTGIEAGGVQGSTDSASGQGTTSADSITQSKRDLEALQTELESTRAQAENDLVAFEKKQTQMILGKIFDALKELAEEDQVTLVVDKSSILFGSADIDLTEKLQRRVRGY